jgi:RNA polymerase sigma-70 factor, ECF subfamily
VTAPGTAGHSISVTLRAADPEPLVGRHDSPVALHRPPTAPTFEEVYDEYFAFVWRCLRRLGVSPAAIDDAVQEVFIVVHRRLGEFEQRSSLKTWLFGIAFRVAGAHRRAAQRRGEPEPLSSQLAAGLPAPRPCAEPTPGARATGGTETARHAARAPR